MSDVFAAIGTPATVTGLTVTAKNGAIFPEFWLEFEFVAMPVALTDGAASGSHGAVKLIDFVPGTFVFESSRVYLSNITESAGVSGGDTVYDIGLGTTAIAAAADGVLTAAATLDNIAAKIDATLTTGALAAAVRGDDLAAIIVNGNSTAVDLNLNISGTAATVDASGTTYLTGNATVKGYFLGADA